MVPRIILHRPVLAKGFLIMYFGRQGLPWSSISVKFILQFLHFCFVLGGEGQTANFFILRGLESNVP